jgi:hypothetical protein
MSSYVLFFPGVICGVMKQFMDCTFFLSIVACTLSHDVPFKRVLLRLYAASPVIVMPLEALCLEQNAVVLEL